MLLIVWWADSVLMFLCEDLSEVQQIIVPAEGKKQFSAKENFVTRGERERNKLKKLFIVWKLNRFVCVWIIDKPKKLIGNSKCRGYENRVVSEFVEHFKKLATKNVIQIMQKRNYFSHGRHILFYIFSCLSFVISSTFVLLFATNDLFTSVMSFECFFPKVSFCSIIKWQI